MISTIAAVDPSKRLKAFYLGLAVHMRGVSRWREMLSNESISLLENVVSNCPGGGGGGVRVAREAVYQ